MMDLLVSVLVIWTAHTSRIQEMVAIKPINGFYVIWCTLHGLNVNAAKAAKQQPCMQGGLGHTR